MNDGYRVLIDRLWPRGLKKQDIALDAWLKAVAPSDTLRCWFNHQPAKWREFCQRYQEELTAHTAALDELAARASTGMVTLLFAARETRFNHAVILQEYLESLVTEHDPPARTQ